MEETGTQETLEAVKDSRPTTAESAGYSDNESEDFSDEEDEFDQDPAEVIREFASHPLMARAQEALEGQLKKTLDRLSTAFKEKEEHVKRIGKEREEVGVDLYGLQQQLARLQLSLENDHENLANLVDLRAQEEHVLQEVKESYKELKASKDEHTKQTQKSQVELDAINDTIRQIEEYNQEMKSEIEVTKRATYKAEDTMVSLEKHKEGQDLLIDSLSTQISRMEEELTLYQSQIDAQKGEVDSSKEILRETSEQMDLINFEKKQLIQYWKSSLIGLTRRNEAMTKARQAFKTMQDKITDIEMEFNGTKRELIEAQNLNETLVGKRDRLENDLRFTVEQIREQQEQRDRLSERYDLIKRSIQETDEEEMKVDLTSKQLGNEMERVMQNIQVVAREKNLLEQQILTEKSEGQTVSKATQNARLRTKEVLRDIHEQEIEESKVSNEMARLDMDILNVRMHTAQLEETYANLERDLKEKEAVIDRYEIEIRQRHDEIEKKMYRVDRLNRQYEKLVEQASRSGDEELTGPLEATIRHLSREIENLNTQTENFQRQWLDLQTEHMTITSDAEEMNEKNSELKARMTVLRQKKIRLDQEYEETARETKSLEKECLTLRNDISKLGALLNQNEEAKNNLEYEATITEMQFVDRLKELESDTVTIQENIRQEEESKRQKMEEIVDTERQVLLWEKKIQLEKEMREALDPSAGQSEVKEMEKEIHRMSLRLDQLNREEESLLKEIERSIYKREDIAVRYSQRSQAQKKSKNNKKKNSHQQKERHAKLTQNQLRKRVSSLKKEMRTVSVEVGNVASEMEEKKKELEEVTDQLERETATYGEMEDQCHDLQVQLNELLYQKQRKKDKANSQKHLLNDIKSFLSDTGSLLHDGNGLKIERDLRFAKESVDNTKSIISTLSSSFPHLSEVLERVMVLADDIQGL